MPDGHPQTQVMWVDADCDHLLINTEVHRRKFKNVERDPRVTITIWEKEDPYSFVEVRGEVVEKARGSEAREHIDELSHKYHGRPYGAPIRSKLVVLRIASLRQVIRTPALLADLCRRASFPPVFLHVVEETVDCAEEEGLFDVA